MMRGAMFCNVYILFTNSGAQVCYDPNAMPNRNLQSGSASAIILPGTWQQLSP